MPATAIVKAGALRRCLTDIQPLFPKGSKTVPLLLSLSGNILTVTCTTGCVYQMDITVSNPDGAIQDMVVQYRGLLDFIPSTGDVEIEMTGTYVTVSGNDFSITLPPGYSEIMKAELPNVQFTQVTSDGYTSGLKALIGMGLSDIYMKEESIKVYGQVATLNYPNVRVQARTLGLNFVAVITPEHADLLARFSPKEIYTDNVEEIILKRNDAFLILPMKSISENNNFVSLLEGLSEPVTLDVEHYVDKLRNMIKLGNKSLCKISFYDKGIMSSVSQDNITISAGLGDVTTKVNAVMQLPIVLWAKMIRALGNNKAQFLYGSDTICLRTQSIIIIARALL